jgi:hypothetical protein
MFTLHNQGIVSDLQVDLGEEEFDHAEDTYCGVNITKTQPNSPTHDNQGSHTNLHKAMESFPQLCPYPEEHNKFKKGSFGPASNTASHPMKGASTSSNPKTLLSTPTQEVSGKLHRTSESHGTSSTISLDP